MAKKNINKQEKELSERIRKALLNQVDAHKQTFCRCCDTTGIDEISQELRRMSRLKLSKAQLIFRISIDGDADDRYLVAELQLFVDCRPQFAAEWHYKA